MKAIICKEYGPPSSLVFEDVDDPQPVFGQVRIAVHAAGLNFPDALIIQGKYQFKPPMPFSPGSEVAGVVDLVGDGVTHLKEGDRVIAVTGWGGFAEKIVTDAGVVIPMPDGMDFATGSALVLAYSTSHYALRDRAALREGETLLVLGASGGVGLAAVEIGKAMGARVIAAASSDDKLKICSERGADETINYTTEDLKDRIKALTNGAGADVIYDPVGGGFSEPALRSIAWGGRYLVIGFAAGDIPKIPLNLALLKGCSIVGVFWGSFTSRDPERFQELLHELFGWVSSGVVTPHISATYPLSDAANAIDDMMARRVTGKVVVLP